MMFFLERGYCVIAHDRRGHGRSTQTVTGNEMDTYAADANELVEKLDLRSKAFSEIDFTEDLKKIEVPTLVMHGEEDQIVPFADSGPLPQSCLRMPRPGSIPACHTACRRLTRTRSTPISLPS